LVGLFWEVDIDGGVLGHDPGDEPLEEWGRVSEPEVLVRSEVGGIPLGRYEIEWREQVESVKAGVVLAKAKSAKALVGEGVLSLEGVDPLVGGSV
jgi:hypothetical protein